MKFGGVFITFNRKRKSRRRRTPRNDMFLGHSITSGLYSLVFKSTSTSKPEQWSGSWSWKWIWTKFKVRIILHISIIKSTQYKKLAPNILPFTWKKWNKEYQTLIFQFFTNRFSILMFFVLFFMWFARFQILISIVFGASFLYWVDLMKNFK